MNDVFVLGHLRLAPIGPDAAREWIVARVRQRVPCVVVTSNIHHLRLAEIDVDFRRAVQSSELNVADGWPLILANRMVGGARLPGRVAGVDLVAAVLASDAPLRVAILGGSDGAAGRLAEQLAERHEVPVVAPIPKGSWEDPEQRRDLCAELGSAEVNLTLVAIGAPQQELLADSLRSYVQGPIICCGATVDLLTGVRPRAPELVQRMRLEWLFRAALEPRRLVPRYVRAGATFTRVVVRQLRSRET